MLSVAERLHLGNSFLRQARPAASAGDVLLAIRNYKEALRLLSSCTLETTAEEQFHILETCTWISKRVFEIEETAKREGKIVPSTTAVSRSANTLGEASREENCEKEQEKNKQNENVKKFQALITKGTTASFENIIGHGMVKRTLFNIILPKTKFAPLVKSLGLKSSDSKLPNCLLFGHPGTGKTQLVQAFASYIKASFLAITPSDILGAYVGESEKNLKSVFVAAGTAPCVLFFDEIDGLFAKKTNTSAGLINEFLTRAEDKPHNVMIFGATNYPFDLPENVQRRFQHKIHVALPIRQERALLLNHFMGRQSKIFEPEEYFRMATETKGYSGWDLMRLVQMMKLRPLEKIQASTHFRKIGNTLIDEKWVPCKPKDTGAVRTAYVNLDPEQIELPKLNFEDFKHAVKRMKRTTNVDDNDENGAVQRMIKFIAADSGF